MLTGLKPILAACGCVLVAAVPAGASTYTLDGQAATREASVAGAGGCAAVASPDDVIACFSSDRARDSALGTSLRAGAIPAGFTSMPTPDQTTALLSRVATSASKRPKARAADVPCGGGPYTHVYTDANDGGIHGYFASTGGAWQNHTSDFNNSISSYNASPDPAYVPYWHDYVNGGGGYYDLAYCGRQVQNLANGNWNDRFSSFKAG